MTPKEKPRCAATGARGQNHPFPSRGIDPVNLPSLPPCGNIQDLFSWALSQAQTPLTLPARRIADRFGLPPRRAVLIAELAGFQEERS